MRTFHYIEPIGVPGSGKTVVARLLARDLTVRGAASSEREPLRGIGEKIGLAWKTLLFVVMHPSVLRLWRYDIVEQYQSMEHIESVIRNVRVRLLVEAAFVRARGPILVNDEGIIGKVVVLSLLTGIEKETMFKLLKTLLPAGTAIVHVDPDPSVAINRALQRPGDLPFFDAMSEDVRRAFYIANANLYKEVVEWNAGPTIRVENNGSRDELAQEVAGVVISFLSS